MGSARMLQEGCYAGSGVTPAQFHEVSQPGAGILPLVEIIIDFLTENRKPASEKV
jgi:hypothetical protein